MIGKSMMENVLEAALEGGAEFSELFFEDRNVRALSMLKGKVENMNLGRDSGVGIRIIEGLNSVYVYTNDLREENLIRLAREAAKAMRGNGKARSITLARMHTEPKNPVRIDPGDVDLARSVDLLRRGNDAILTYDPIITQAVTSYFDEDQKVTIANSEGLLVHDRRVRGRFAAQAVATYNGDMQTGFEGPGASKGFEFFETMDVEAVAREAARTAVTMAKADYIDAGEMTVIMDNAFGGVLFHESCGHGLEASFVSKGESIYAGKRGERIASELVSAYDDGTIPGAWGTLTVDDEGTPTQKNLLIENGILKNYLVDRLTGKRMGLETTGSSRRQSYKYAPTSRMNNTYIAPGKSTLEEMIAATDYGLYAKKLGGGSVDVVTGEFNFSVLEGYLVENGKIVRPVRGASLIGKGYEVLQKIDMVGKNFDLGCGMCGAGSGSIPVLVGQPALRISSLTVGGR